VPPRLRHVVFKFWYLVWFFLAPASLSWITVSVLDRLEVVDEFEPWYVLLLFAVLVIILYAVRDKLPLWRDRDAGSLYNRDRRARAAQKMTAHVQKLVTKKAHKISVQGRSELAAALEASGKAIADKDDERISACIRKLEEKTTRYLAFARKSVAREYFESIGVAILIAVILRLFCVEAFKIPSESMVPTLMVGDHIFVSKYLYGVSVPFVNKRVVRFASPARGDVVVFVKPSRAEQTGVSLEYIGDEFQEPMAGTDFIKRIVGLPDDIVEMKDDVLWINGVEVPRCRVGTAKYRARDEMRQKWVDEVGELWVEKLDGRMYTILETRNDLPVENYGPMKVGYDQVFVLGDNRDNSNDSRSWGMVPFDNIKGRASVIWWSNRRPHGFQWDRVGTLIMGEPALTEDQRRALERCEELRSKRAR
jgi:signal peptidase I